MSFLDTRGDKKDRDLQERKRKQGGDFF